MNWEKFFGNLLYQKLKCFCEGRNTSIASTVRAAVAFYISKQEG